MLSRNERVRATYDEVATEYAARISDELEGKPLDCALLDHFVKTIGRGGRVCDAGCGPGHVSRYLRDRGLNVFGLDLSPAMLAEARRLNPDIDFVVGDLNAIPVEAEALDGVLAFYSLIHLPREEVEPALRNIGQSLRPTGRLFVAFHIGSGELHLDEWWGRTVSIDFTMFEVDEMKGYLRAAGYAIGSWMQREPYPDVEHPTRRSNIIAVWP